MKLGTRGSALALWQARTVAHLIEQSGGPHCEVVVIRTSGDEPAGPPDAPGTPGTPGTVGTLGTENVKRAFVKEIEEALLEGRIDLAVHSGKDLPAVLPEGLVIGAALEREDPRDALLLPAGSTARDLEAIKKALGSHPRVGTSSVRRAAELRALFPDATFVPIRGNVDTRLRKLDAGDCDVLVLAAAGLKRLGLDARISVALPIEVSVPAPGQGILAVEIANQRPDEVRRVVSAISDPDAYDALIAERAVVQTLGGGCQMPLGAIATLEGQDLSIIGLVASPDGRRVIRARVHGHRGHAAAVGEKLARQLRAQGAAEILSSLHTK